MVTLVHADHVFKIMQGYGGMASTVGLSVSLDSKAPCRARNTTVKNGADHVLLVDVGPAEQVKPAVTSIGRCFARIERRATVIYGDMMTRITKMLSMVPPTLVERSGAVVIPVSARFFQAVEIIGLFGDARIEPPVTRGGSGQAQDSVRIHLLFVIVVIILEVSKCCECGFR